MADLRPFRGYRPPPELAAEVAAPPYDVVSTREARQLAVGKPRSFLHVSRAEIDLPDKTDEHDPAVYARAARNLTSLFADHVLVQDAEPSLYLYAQKMGAHRQVGVVACASVADYLSGRIKKHENTRPDKEDDRTRHLVELGAHDEPVFLTYHADKKIDRLVGDATKQPPALALTTDDGVEHRLWVLPRPASQALVDAFGAVEALYVADGHHRTAAAARAHQELRGDGREHDVFLAVVFPHDQVQILPYNRLVRDLRARSPEALLAELGGSFTVEAAVDAADATPREPKTFGIYVAKKWYRARARAGAYDAGDVVASLDCSICQDKILGPICGVSDPRRDRHVDFVGGIRGTSALEARVDSGEFTVAIHLFPTQVEELIAVSDAGLLMPPKSTWFEPKLKSGLFLHTF